MKSPKQLLKMKHELKQLTEEELIAADIYELRQERAHWVDMSNNGCSDPAFPDGVNMNLCRNHIERTAAELAAHGKPAYLSYVPDEVPDRLMVAGGKWFDMRMKAFRKEYGDSIVIDNERQLKLF